MSFENNIASKCLYGFIKDVPKNEQLKCISAIESTYGEKIASMVKNYITKL